MHAIWGNVIVIAVLAAAVFLAVGSLRKSRRGRGGCNGDCGSCRGCH